MFKVIETHRISYLLTSPSHIGLALNSPDVHLVDFKSVRIWCAVGAPLVSVYRTKMTKLLKYGIVAAGYGLSEIAGLLTFCDNLNKTNSAGCLVSSMSAKIIRDDGSVCGSDEDGEICIQGKYSMMVCDNFVMIY